MKKLLLVIAILFSFIPVGHADSWTSKDKLEHRKAGFQLTLIAYTGIELVSDVDNAEWIAFGLFQAAGVAREISTRNTTGFSKKDITMNVFGGLLAVGSILLSKKLGFNPFYIEGEF